MTDEQIQRIADAVLERIVSRLGAPASAPSPAPAREPRYASVAEYAKRVGYHRSTVAGWIRAGMPAVQAGRGHRVDVKAADDWIKRGGARAAARRAALT